MLFSCKDNIPPSSTKRVLVTAHRGDWRNFPENSLEGLESCAAMGIDIMETDLGMTKDSVLVLMHDETLDRTTTGTGYVRDYTLDSIKKLNLKNGYGYPTPYKIPTLKEALQMTKGKIMIDLDKSYPYIQDAFTIVKEAGMLDQVIFRVNDSWKIFKKKHANIVPEIKYMPLVWWNTENPKTFIKTYLKAPFPPFAIEIIYKTENSQQLLALEKLDLDGVNIMMNTIYPHLCAGHDDYKALNDMDSNWGWVIDKGATIIGTDRPKMLLNYIKVKKHTN
ncbi:MAG: glycerophosphodiester phosphodiesterase family protein [Polaribacter sp.]